ncbi:MAG: CbtA family protein [Nocardioides sp.]
MRITHLLRYGLAAGAAAGLAAALVMWLVVEPVIRRALVVEHTRDARSGRTPDELVSRTAQVAVGLGTTAVVGMLFGLVFTVVFARVRHRLPAATEQGRAVLLAAIGFAVFVLMPAIRIPANPPAVGDPATVTRRTLVYLLTVLLSLLLAGALFALDTRLQSTALDPVVRRCLVAAAGVAGVVVLLLVVPGNPDRIPSDVPAGLVWDFRLASLAQLGVQWGVLGLGFGALVGHRRAAR